MIKKISQTEMHNQVCSKLFVSEEIRDRYHLVKCRWVTDIYVYLIENKIVSFIELMKEELKCGFLHYHIPGELKDFFSKKYPEIDKLTNQIYYIYTDESFRRKGLAGKLLEYVVDILINKNYQFLWLKNETHSNIYHRNGFVNFIDVIDLIDINTQEFVQDYEQKIGNITKLINGYGDRRLVKLLNSRMNEKKQEIR